MKIIRHRKGLKNEESIDGSYVRSYVIMPRWSRSLQNHGHKTLRQGLKILIHVQGYIQDYDVAQYGVSIISELTQWLGSLTRLASDLGQAHQKYVCTISF
jgi:hypothetical protein